MNKKLLMRRCRQLIARVNYYGPIYLPEYIYSRLRKTTEIPVVKKKMVKYPSVTEAEIKEEVAKWYRATTGDVMDFENPKTFTQKIQWSKVYDRDSQRTTLSDKYLVREWIKEKIGEKYLIPMLGVWNSFDEIDFSSLPEQFVLKCTHGTQCNVIVDDKKKLDKSEAKKNIEKWMKLNYAYISFELQYKDIVPRIMAEQFIQNSGSDLYDYKIYCYGGKPKYIQFLSDRKYGLRMAYFDTNWTKMDFVHDHPRIEEDIKKPDNLDEMLHIAEILSEGFPYVRVDLYRLDNGELKFGEMTFTPAGGGQNFIPPEADGLLGRDYRVGRNK